MNGIIPSKIAFDLALEREMEIRRAVARMQSRGPAAAPAIPTPLWAILAQAARRLFSRPQPQPCDCPCA